MHFCSECFEAKESYEKLVEAITIYIVKHWYIDKKLKKRSTQISYKWWIVSKQKEIVWSLNFSYVNGYTLIVVTNLFWKCMGIDIFICPSIYV